MSSVAAWIVSRLHTTPPQRLATARVCPSLAAPMYKPSTIGQWRLSMITAASGPGAWTRWPSTSTAGRRFPGCAKFGSLDAWTLPAMTSIRGQTCRVHASSRAARTRRHSITTRERRTTTAHANRACVGARTLWPPTTRHSSMWMMGLAARRDAFRTRHRHTMMQAPCSTTAVRARTRARPRLGGGGCSRLAAWTRGLRTTTLRPPPTATALASTQYQGAWTQ